MIQLFELETQNPKRRMSPFVWRIRLALLHKGLAFEGLPVTFLDKTGMEPSGSAKVPVIKDGDTWVSDSFDIACYLDKTYPDAPLMKDVALARFFNAWVNRTVISALFPMLTLDICKALDAENAAFFRATREKVIGCTFEEACEGRLDKRSSFQQTLSPMRDILKNQPFLDGESPAWSDYTAGGAFIWALLAPAFDPLEGDDILIAWRNRILDLYNQNARKAILG